MPKGTVPIDTFDDYIYGKRELRDITMSYRAGFVAAMNGPERSDCGNF